MTGALLLQETIVVRNGKQLTLSVEKLVVGDVVEVKSGDRLPADIRIAHSAGFKVHVTCMYYVAV